MSKTRRNKSNDDNSSRQLQAFKRKKNDLSAPVDWEEDLTLYLQNLHMSNSS